ncbi:hypothetical protein CDAR_107021 [Caerostris darwini]|uniref:Uncharacterized protein n=1 Tax=Caerostris darwini TaxID=1538125 RepID=A0AAV4SXZ0_9ARAC|nr:hypothetical protein CDAR_107021 [Caerostris darwini]
MVVLLKYQLSKMTDDHFRQKGQKRKTLFSEKQFSAPFINEFYQKAKQTNKKEGAMRPLKVETFNRSLLIAFWDSLANSPLFSNGDKCLQWQKR